MNEREKRISDRCPACDRTTLFVADGGGLTCSYLSCPQPIVSRAVAAMAAERDQWKALAERHERDSVTQGLMATNEGAKADRWKALADRGRRFIVGQDMAIEDGEGPNLGMARLTAAAMNWLHEHETLSAAAQEPGKAV